MTLASKGNCVCVCVCVSDWLICRAVGVLEKDEFGDCAEGLLHSLLHYSSPNTVRPS